MTAENKVLPVGTFEEIASRCMEVLRVHGFFPQMVPLTQVWFREPLLSVCDFLSYEPSGNTTPKKSKTGLTRKTLDQLTLKCALTFTDIKGLQFNESLNAIREEVVCAVLEAMGYERPNVVHSDSRWSCYRLYEQVARLDGLTASEIKENRAWAKKHHTEHYEP